jgi:hypothetical protein
MKTPLKVHIDTLARLGIHSDANLDAWIKQNPRVDAQGRKYLMSRYDAYKEILGTRGAEAIMTAKMLSAY